MDDEYDIILQLLELNGKGVEMAGTGAMRKRIIELENENAALKAELACRGTKPAKKQEKASTRYTYGLKKTSPSKE